MKIELRPIDDIIPYTQNPRKITGEAVTAVANSIKEFGWRQPIVVDTEGVIIVGHTRHAAARRLGLEKAPVHVMKCDEATARAYRLADNRLSEQTDWDIGKLTSELTQAAEFDMTEYGFTNMEIELSKIPELDIMTGAQAEPWGGNPDDLVTEKIEEPKVILYFGTDEAKELFFEWLATQDANFRKQTAGSNSTHIAYMPARDQNKFDVETPPAEGEKEKPGESGQDKGEAE